MQLNYREIGKNIRLHRVKKQLKQWELADRVHVSAQHISHIENGYTKLSLVTLVAICNVLEVDCNTILGTSLEGAQHTALQNRLINTISTMDTPKLKLLSDFCKTLSRYEVETAIKYKK